MQVLFKNIQNEGIKNAFNKVYERYEQLHAHRLILKQRRIKGSTMQAQPIINFFTLFSKHKIYKIRLAEFVRDSKKLRVEELPYEVLTGWFAHELAHVIDYTRHSTLGMIVYGLRYLISRRFRLKVEHEADYIAIEHGFHDEIINTKKFIFSHEHIKSDYKEKIKRYYLSIKDVELTVAEKLQIDPVDSPALMEDYNPLNDK